jgi:hypothetical protein
MIQRTVRLQTRNNVRVAAQSADAGFPMAFMALTFGVIAGVGIAGVVIPAVMKVVVPAIVRIVTGA